MKFHSITLSVLTCSAVFSQAGLGSVPDSILDDPKFRNAFVGSYGIHSEIEPTLSEEEQILLEDIYGALGDDPATLAGDIAPLITQESSAALNFVLGNLYFQSDQWDRAIQEYENAIDKFPNFARAHRNLGLAQARKGDFDGAIFPLTKTIELGRKDSWIYGVLATAFFRKGNYLAAESAYRNALLFDPEMDAYEVGVVRCMFRQNKFADTVAATKNLLKEFPDRKEFWMIQAESYLKLDELAKAAENFEVVRRLGQADPAMLKKLGQIYLKQDLPTLASSAFLDALKMDGVSGVSGALDAAQRLAEGGSLDQTKKILQSVQQLSGGGLPEFEQTRYAKLQARVLISEEKEGRAVALLEEIVQEDPLDGEALMLLGDYYRNKGEMERSGFYYERASSLEAFEADAKVKHAQLLVANEKYLDALPLLRQAQSINPRQSVEEYLSKVERLSRRR